MSDINRRAFLRNSAGVAGASLLSTHIASGSTWIPDASARGDEAGAGAAAIGGQTPEPNGLTLNVTIRGLCVFVRRKDKSVDVVMLNHEQRSNPPDDEHPVIHEHAARLIAEDERVVPGNAEGMGIGAKLIAWKLRGYRVEIVPSGAAAETVILQTAIEHPWQSFQWLMNLKRCFPEGKLRTNLHEGGDIVVASLLKLSGGRLEGMAPSTGLGNLATWTITSQEPSPKTFDQAMTDQVLYRLALPAGTTTVTIKRTPLKGKVTAPPVKDIVLSVTPKAEPLTITLDHTLALDAKSGQHPGQGTNIKDNSALPHSVVFYDVFSNAPDLGPIPKKNFLPTERLPQEDLTIERIQVNDTDPYCQVAYYDEEA
jgi:hypothetical protein